jgi:hypothetical protein
VGLEVVVNTYVDVQSWGTPQMILEKLVARRELLGEFELNAIPWYGSMSIEEAEASVTLFGKKVIPEFHRL